MTTSAADADDDDAYVCCHYCNRPQARLVAGPSESQLCGSQNCSDMMALHTANDNDADDYESYSNQILLVPVEGAVGGPILTSLTIKTLRPIGDVGGNLALMVRDGLTDLLTAVRGERSALILRDRIVLRAEVFESSRFRRHDRSLDAVYNSRVIALDKEAATYARFYDVSNSSKTIVLDDFFDRRRRLRTVRLSGVPAAETNTRYRMDVAFRIDQGAPNSALFGKDTATVSVYVATGLNLGPKGRMANVALVFQQPSFGSTVVPQKLLYVAVISYDVMRFGKSPDTKNKSLFKRIFGRSSNSTKSSSSQINSTAVLRPIDPARDVLLGIGGGGSSDMAPEDSIDAWGTTPVDARFLRPTQRAQPLIVLQDALQGKVPKSSLLSNFPEGDFASRALRLIAMDAELSRNNLQASMIEPRDSEYYVGMLRIQLHGSGQPLRMRKREETLDIIISKRYDQLDQVLRTNPLTSNFVMTDERREALVQTPGRGQRYLMLVRRVEENGGDLGAGNPFFLSDLYAPTNEDARTRKRSMAIELRAQSVRAGRTWKPATRLYFDALVQIMRPYSEIIEEAKRDRRSTLLLVAGVRPSDSDSTGASKKSDVITHITLQFARDTSDDGQSVRWVLERIHYNAIRRFF